MSLRFLRTSAPLLAIGLLLPVLLLPTSATAGQARPAERVGVKRVDLRVLPGLVQPGDRTRPSDRAKHVTEVTVRPRRAGVKVKVQVAAGEGWRTVATRRTDRQGAARFSLRARRAGTWALYRARAAGTVSPERSAEQWAEADFVDEFDGRRLSRAWTHRMRVYNPAGLRACSRGNPRATKVTQGALRLSVLRDKRRGSAKCWALRNGKRRGPYAYRINGHVSTERSYAFRYGFAAARVKFQPQRGQHGSFWLQPQSHIEGGKGPKYTGAEIDVIEWFGRGGPTSGLAQFTYHNTRGGKRVKTGGLLPNPGRFLHGRNDSWFRRYHVFSLEWTPKQYVFRIDGQVSWRSRVGISHRPQFPILSLLSSDYEIARVGDGGLGSQHMDVDWIKVWETGR